MKPTPPVVRCKQQDGPQIPKPPLADEWIAWTPPVTAAGIEAMAVLSEAAVTWIVEAAGVVRTEKGLRKVEHDCLDKLEKEGLIQQ